MKRPKLVKIRYRAKLRCCGTTQTITLTIDKAGLGHAREQMKVGCLLCKKAAQVHRRVRGRGLA